MPFKSLFRFTSHRPTPERTDEPAQVPVYFCTQRRPGDASLGEDFYPTNLAGKSLRRQVVKDFDIRRPDAPDTVWAHRDELRQMITTSGLDAEASAAAMRDLILADDLGRIMWACQTAVFVNCRPREPLALAMLVRASEARQYGLITTCIEMPQPAPKRKLAPSPQDAFDAYYKYLFDHRLQMPSLDAGLFYDQVLRDHLQRAIQLRQRPPRPVCMPAQKSAQVYFGEAERIDEAHLRSALECWVAQHVGGDNTPEHLLWYE